MTYIQRVWEALEAGLWRFIRLIHNANHDYPYHDFVVVYNEAADPSLKGSYTVGTSNVDAHGDQTKKFVSKRANLWTDSSGTIVRFNDSRNVAVLLEPIGFDETGVPTWWRKEFYTNIAVVHYDVPVGHVLYMYFEGVLPEEARDAE